MEPESPPASPVSLQEYRDCCAWLRPAGQRGESADRPRAASESKRARRNWLRRFSSVFDSFCSGKVEASGVQVVPHEFEQGARHRLLKIKLHSLAIGHHPQLVRIGIRNRLNICPPPSPAVTAVLRDIIYATVHQPKRPVASARPHAMVSRDFRHSRNAWARDAIAH